VAESESEVLTEQVKLSSVKEIRLSLDLIDIDVRRRWLAIGRVQI
jgi:hypothetical protein